MNSILRVAVIVLLVAVTSAAPTPGSGTTTEFELGYSSQLIFGLAGCPPNDPGCSVLDNDPII